MDQLGALEFAVGKQDETKVRQKALLEAVAALRKKFETYKNDPLRRGIYAAEISNLYLQLSNTFNNETIAQIVPFDADEISAYKELMNKAVLDGASRKKRGAVINTIRLKSLPERKGPNGQPVFLAGSGDMSNLIQQLPELIARVEQRVSADSNIPKAVDLTAFDRYRNNVEALRRINAIIKHYLDIDVTLSRSDTQSLAEGLRTVRR